MSWRGFGVFAGECLTQNLFDTALHSHAPPQPPYAPGVPRMLHSLLIFYSLALTTYSPSSSYFNKLTSCRSFTFMISDHGS